jgi:hypothetical protein
MERRSSSTLLVVLAAALHASCIDPTHDQAVDALGPEVAGVPRGPTHRAGQPCLTCHGGSGPGAPEMAVGGTIYAARGGTTPLEGVRVTLTDAKGAQRTTSSNVVGNFYVFKSAWEPEFPLSVALSYGDERLEMKTPIGRDGACASCHRGAGDREHMPAVFLRSQ